MLSGAVIYLHPVSRQAAASYPGAMYSQGGSLFVFLELDKKGGCRYSDPEMLRNGPADLLGHFIG